MSILRLACAHLGEVHVTAPVFDEVRQLDASSAAALGLRVHEPSLELVFEAAASRGPLSFQDKLCLLVAKTHGWTCVSNDKRLRTSCLGEGVAVMWGFGVLELLVSRGALPPADAIALARMIAAENRRIGQAVVAAFIAKMSARK